MKGERLSPGMEHRGDADLGPEVLGPPRWWSGSRPSPEEDIVNHRLVLVGDVAIASGSVNTT